MTTEHTCDECGETFEAANALGAHKTFKHSDEYQSEYKDAETLQRLYHGKSMSTIEIAEKYDVDPSTINKYMREGGIERRKGYKDPTRPPSHLLDESHGEGVGNAYEKIRTYHDGDRSVVLLHRLIAYAHGKLDFEGLCSDDVVVHHESGHGLDNRPSNLSVKSFCEHASDHAKERQENAPWRDKKKFKQMFEDMTQRDMADEFGCSTRTIYEWKERHGLE